MKKASSVLRNYEGYREEAIRLFKRWSSQGHRPIKLVRFSGVLPNRDQWRAELGYNYVALFTIAAETLLGNIWEEDVVVSIKNGDFLGRVLK